VADPHIAVVSRLALEDRPGIPPRSECQLRLTERGRAVRSEMGMLVFHDCHIGRALLILASSTVSKNLSAIDTADGSLSWR